MAKPLPTRWTRYDQRCFAACWFLFGLFSGFTLLNSWWFILAILCFFASMAGWGVWKDRSFDAY